MKNQTPTQTEPGRDAATLGACDIFGTRLGPVRSAAPVKPETQFAWLDGQETSSKLVESLRQVQMISSKNSTVMNGNNPLAEWCRQLPALHLESKGAFGFRWHKDGWQAKINKAKNIYDNSDRRNQILQTSICHP